MTKHLKKLFLISVPADDKVYTPKEVSWIHNFYRTCILLLLVGWIWVAHHYGFADDMLSFISRGNIEIDPDTSFLNTLISLVKWLASIFAGIFTFIQLGEYLFNQFKKKIPENNQ